MGMRQRTADILVATVVGAAAIIATAAGHGDLFERLLYDPLCMYYLLVVQRDQGQSRGFDPRAVDKDE